METESRFTLEQLVETVLTQSSPDALRMVCDSMENGSPVTVPRLDSLSAIANYVSNTLDELGFPLDSTDAGGFDETVDDLLRVFAEQDRTSMEALYIATHMATLQIVARKALKRLFLLPARETEGYHHMDVVLRAQMAFERMSMD